jgi:hypothetical protein
LLARHGIERETGGHFGHALGSLGDHHEVDDGQNQEHHQSDHKIAGDDELPERLDDMAGVGLNQNQTRRRDGEGEPKQCCQQQDRGKRGKFNDVLQVDRCHQQDCRES